MATCTHLDTINVTVTPAADGCEDCLAIGGQWEKLRLCQGCGHVGCCDSSPHRHATAHHEGTGHPVIRSFEPGEEWFYCYPEALAFELDDVPPGPSHS